MDFANCSSCNHWPRVVAAADKRRYFVSSCGKLYCAHCMQRQDGKCICPGGACRVLEVNGEASPEVKGLFTDPMTPIQDILNCVKRAMKITEFQNGLRSGAIQTSKKMYDAFRSQNEQFESVKNENKELKKDLEQLKRAFETSQQQNDLLQRENERLQSQLNERPPSATLNLVTPPSRDGRASSSPNDSLNNLFQAPAPPRPNVRVQPFFASESPSPPLFANNNNANRNNNSSNVPPAGGGGNGGGCGGGGSFLSAANSTPRVSHPQFLSDRFSGERVTMQNETGGGGVGGGGGGLTPRNYAGNYRPGPSPAISTPMSALSSRTGNSLSPLTPSYAARVRGATTTPLRGGITDRLRSLRCTGSFPGQR